MDAIEQFQVVTSGGQAELGRALGGYVNIVTKSGTNAVHGSVYDYVRDDGLNAPNPLIDRTLPMSQSQFGGSIGGPLLKNRTFYFSNVEQRHLDQSGWSRFRTDRRRHQRAAGGGRLRRGRRSRPASSRSPLDQRARQGRSSGWRTRSIQRALQPLPSRLGQLAQRRRHERAERGDRRRQSRPDRRAQQHADAVVAHGARDSRAARGQRFHGAARRSGRSGGEHCRRRVVRHELGQPAARRNTLYQIVNNLSHQTGSHALRFGVDFIYNDDRITYPRAFRGSYSFSSLANFLSGVYNNAGFTQTFGTSEVSQANPNLALHAQDEWKLSSRITLNTGVRYDLQWLETIAPTRTICHRASAWCGRPSPPGERSCAATPASSTTVCAAPRRGQRPALGRQHDRRVATCGRSRSACRRPGLGAGVSRDPREQRPIRDSSQLDDDGSAAAERLLASGSVEVEQQIGERSTVSAGYHYVARRAAADVHQPERAGLRRLGQQQRLPAQPNYANNSQYSPAGTSTYHGLHVSLLHRPARWGQHRVSTRCRRR